MKSGTWLRLFALGLLLQQGAAYADNAPDGPDLRQPVTLEDIGAIVDVGSPQISPDGQWVAYESADQVFIVSTRSGPAKSVTTGGSTASGPRWSANGKALYFLSDRSGSSQLWKLDLQGFGEAVQVTGLDVPVNTIRLSPDETRLLLPLQASATSAAAGEKRKPWVIDRLQFKEDADDGYITDDPPGHLQVYELASRKLTPVTSGAYVESEAAWSPDGREIVFVSNREADPDASYRTDIWRIAASGDGDLASPVRLTNNDHTKQAPAWSPDG
ncbi:MAG: LpqB family beta-propeller domain-containing protein, partial [Woeseiaceae bacterium]|nr:LpqB family beta-propeller domain-containing protein [Woeseiaceae bacterium]